MFKLSKFVEEIVGEIPKNSSFLKASLIANWKEVVGSDICEIASVFDVKTLQNNEVSIILKVDGAAALLVRYNQDIIMDRISRFLGKKVVTKLIITQRT